MKKLERRVYSLDEIRSLAVKGFDRSNYFYNTIKKQYDISKRK